MIIGGFQKTTLLDFPGNVACLMFTYGCNLRCPFCQNGSLVLKNKEITLIKEEEIFAYLDKRKKILDGIVISGGEPLLQKDIVAFIKRVKDYNLKIKLDTNGTFPDILEELINLKLIDYVAMDIKNSFVKYGLTTGSNRIDIDNIKRSIKIIKESGIDHEFRTTVVKEFHTINDIKEICKIVGKKDRYYLQNYQDSENVIKKGLHGFDENELLDIIKEINTTYSNVFIR